ncbi:hypothetical protein ERIN107935_01600 [Erysipelothrix inopinata]
MKNENKILIASIGILPLILIHGFLVSSPYSVVDGYGRIMIFRSIIARRLIYLYLTSFIIFGLSIVQYSKNE